MMLMQMNSSKSAIALILALCLHWANIVSGALELDDPGVTPSNANVNENAPIGTILSVDGDATTDHIRMKGGNPSTWAMTGTGCTTNFQLQVDTGDSKRATLRVLAVQDYDTAPNSYICTITATDPADPPVNLQLAITINNLIDEAPAFTAASYACTIDEELTTNTLLPTGCHGTYTDVEVDTVGDTVTCSLSGTHASKFVVDTVTSEKTCKPRLAEKLDYEEIGTGTLTFDIRARDSGGLESVRPVTVTLNDINDNTPQCPTSTISVTRTETFIGEIVSSLACTDRDSGVNGDIEYSLMDAASGTYFAINADSGRLTNIAALDYDTATKSNYSTVVIKVVDKGTTPGPLTSSVTVLITITAENDNAPVWGTFTPAYTTATTPITNISELADSGLVAFTAQATDADYTADGVITYSIQSVRGSDLSNLMTAFQVNSVSGEVSVKTKGILDRESITYADVTLLANDNPSSGTPNTITRVVRVAISDANELAPMFTPSTGVYATTIAEGTAANTAVLDLSVVDPDASAATVTCSIVAGNVANLFKISGKQIQTNVAIEPDAPTSQAAVTILTVSCSDGGLTSTATATVSVSLINDNTPTITLPAGNTITIPEDQALGKIADITGTDNDAGIDGQFTCSVSPVGVFSIPGACDQLMLVQSLDRETTDTHNLVLTIQDKGSPSNSATVSVTVSVTDVNDNNPVCTPSTYFASIPETSAAVASLTTITCSDADSHGIFYSSNTTGFSVDSNTGVVGYTGGADYDTGPSSYDVIVYAIDKNDANKFAQATVRVTITNVNEHTPTFTAKTVSVTETIFGGQLVTSFTAADADKSPDSIQTYTITAGDSSNYFSINSNGDIFVQSGRTLDYESLKAAGTTSWTLTVRAVDGGSPTPLSGDGTITINLADANDNAPVFSQSTYTGTVAEGTTTVTPVVTVAATDADADGTNNHAVVRFSFPTANTYFAVDATSGVVSKTSANLEYNTFQTVSIPVIAVDNAGAGPNTATATVVITVTDTNVAPTCSLATKALSVDEDVSLGTEIWSLTSPTIVCTDADTTQTLTYSLKAGSAAEFSIHPTTGSLVVTKSLDFETATSHSLTVVATDNHATPMSAEITVTVTVADVNEFSPTCTVPTSASINENVASTTVYSVTSCTDADTSSTAFTYSVVAPTSFAVSTAGVVSNSATFDYETSTTTHVVQVKVTDNAPTPLRTTTYTTTVTVVPLNDNAPVFTTAATVYADLEENSGIGTALTLTNAAGGTGGAATIAATDADTGVASHSTIVYSIASGNDRGWFKINPSSGVISVASTVDREAASSVTLGIAAADQAGTAAASTVNVVITVTDVNDNPPVFPTAQFTVNISEGNTPPNTVVDWSATSALTDADTGSNAAITLTILSGVSTSPNNEFSISGKQLVTAKTFDLPTDSTQYVIKVIARDGGTPQLTGTATVTVNIVEANKVAPTFASGSDSISVPESTTIGSTLYNVTATDTDVGLGGVISYSLKSVSPSSTLFTVSDKTGLVVLQNAIDYDTLATKVFTLTISATDSGTPVKSNDFTLTITITDSNDNDPVFNAGNEFTKSFAENVGVDFDVTTVGWTDADSGAAGNVACSITTQTTPAIFKIDSSTCKIQTSANPDREARAVHSVEVQLTDGGSPSRSKRAVFTFTITDINDNPPVFDVPSLVTSVVENLGTGAAVTTVSATDLDAGTNGAFDFSLVDHITAGDKDAFTIDATTGVITTAVSFDREAKDFYTFRVLAIDRGASALTGTAIVNVTITDVNDNTPAWVSAPYTATVSEGASLGTLVKSVTATDADSTFGVLTYSIIGGDTLGLFRINNQTGRVETATSSGLNRESVGIWNLTLRVQDNGSPTPLSADAELKITVTDVNEFAPAWVNSSYNFRIIENSVVNSPVGTVTAQDNDAGPVNNQITYAIDAFLQGGEYFSIDPSTAQISVSVAALDRETLDTHMLRIVASDQATPSKTATNCLTVTIYITDANDHDPVFSRDYYNASVAENAAIGFNVLTVSGSDNDTGINADLRYSINTSDANGAIANEFFTMNAVTGLLTVKTNLDWETNATFHFPIIISDQGTAPQRSSSASVYIVVQDVNDVAPTLSSNFYNAEVPQVDDGNMEILRISATDPDSGVGGSVSYEWSDNVPYFRVDATTGIVRRNTLNSVESYRIYSQNVVAKDQGTPQLTSTASKVRIDTFPAESYIVMIHFSMSEADYLSQLATIKTNLAKTLSGKYPDARVGQWKYHMYGGNVVGYFYSLANTLTDNSSYINVDKQFVPYSDLLAFWRFDSLGTPTAILRGSDFTATPIVKVEPYPQAAATPWYQTWWGILLLTLAALAAAALLAAAAYGLYVCISALCAPKPPAAPITKAVKPPPIRERQILELNKDKHPRHHPKPKGRYLIKESQGQNRGAQQQTPSNRTTTPRADFDQQQNTNPGRVTPTDPAPDYANLDF